MSHSKQQHIHLIFHAIFLSGSVDSPLKSTWGVYNIILFRWCISLNFLSLRCENGKNYNVCPCFFVAQIELGQKVGTSIFNFIAYALDGHMGSGNTLYTHKYKLWMSNLIDVIPSNEMIHSIRIQFLINFGSLLIIKMIIFSLLISTFILLVAY